MRRFFDPQELFLSAEPVKFHNALVAAQRLNDYCDFSRNEHYPNFSLIDGLFRRIAYILIQQINESEDKGSAQICIAVNRLLDKSEDPSWVDSCIVGAYREVLLAISRFIMLIKEFDQFYIENPYFPTTFYQIKITQAIQAIYLAMQSTDDELVRSTSFQALGSCGVELLKARSPHFPNIQYVHDDYVLSVESISEETYGMLIRYDLYNKRAELF